MSLRSKTRQQDPSAEDRLSSLPSEVLNIILGKIPFKSAVQTCVLAKKWRKRWLALSKFDLNSKDLTVVPDNEVFRWAKVASITNEFIRRHTGRITSFSLRTGFLPHYTDLYKWIYNLAMQNIESLCLQEYEKHPSEIPIHMFSFEKLLVLKLINFRLRAPPSLRVFNTLLELSLERVAINDLELYRLIASCPNLDKLSLLNISGLDRLRIHAPKLTKLVIDTRFQDIGTGAGSILSSVIIVGSHRAPGERVILNQRSVIHCLSRLRLLQTLHLPGDFIELLAADSILEYWPLLNNTVTTVALGHVRFETVSVFKLCISLLTNCPNIKLFGFSIQSSKGPELIANFLKENRGRFLFRELKAITIICPRRCEMGCSLTFVEFLSRHSPNLKIINIMKEGSINAFIVSQIILQLKTTCPWAEVQYFEDEIIECL
ncbi:F-box/FBD/LRR-repeat protein At1g13570-like isoform X1 [Amaranthus tricolor]|uniref:F-box/FBD/LRR-repeat protein At1g13570-like isoform X1 n=1 Tax=Amaranthus tricolor TaxID=29722 RepID=UPI00258974BE|nr:F-box/FBD/LRR-repeat protein At1g13570-like isoform X1 [Amaranthus tricolor]XP_057524717.1 F-box/FBD/LRR-repeat protein At1g13570-like isoform X1 [Amaranthus tricolor]XP_057524718.1 F-box/FBD/LRR-repeat protein At1g13570-like isoform X1 [Amaranthus tricolor]